MKPNETLTESERAHAGEYPGLLVAKLLRLYDAALASSKIDAETCQEALELAKLRTDERDAALARAEAEENALKVTHGLLDQAYSSMRTWHDKALAAKSRLAELESRYDAVLKDFIHEGDAAATLRKRVAELEADLAAANADCARHVKEKARERELGAADRVKRTRAFLSATPAPAAAPCPHRNATGTGPCVLCTPAPAATAEPAKDLGQFTCNVCEFNRYALRECRAELEEAKKHHANLDRKNGELNRDLWERIEYVSTQSKNLDSARAERDTEKSWRIDKERLLRNQEQAYSKLEARVAELEADKVRMREWLDLKDLSEDAPRARETIRSLRTRMAQARAELEHDDYARYAARRALEFLR